MAQPAIDHGEREAAHDSPHRIPPVAIYTTLCPIYLYTASLLATPPQTQRKGAIREGEEAWPAYD